MQTETLLAVIAVADAANFVVLLLILLQLRSRAQPHPPHRQPRSVRLTYSAPYAYAIWCWKDGRWELDRGSVPPGVDPGPPPTDPGEYPNQMVKTGCYRSP